MINTKTQTSNGVKTITRVSSETEDILRDDALIAGQISGAVLDFLKRKWFDGAHRKKFFAVITLVIVIAVGFGVYARYFHLTGTQQRAQKELATAITGVSKLMILPEKDEPVLATVTDAEALVKQQAFFTGAMNGDQLLLFPKNMKAVIYSPSRNKIINAGPIEQQQASEAAKSEIRNPAGNLFSFGEGPKSETPNQSSQSSDAAGQANLNVSSSAEATAGRQNTLTVEIRNGTGKNGLAAQVAENIRAAGYAVVAVTDAKITNYAKTIVFNRAADEAKKQSVNELAVALGAEVVRELSRGEANTEADALVILGGE